MDFDDDSDSFDSIRALIQLESNVRFLMNDLDLAIHRQSKSVVLQGIILRNLIQAREELEGRASRFSLAVEEELKLDDGSSGAAQFNFLALATSTLDRFDVAWTGASTHEAREMNWMNSLRNPSSESAILRFLSQVLQPSLGIGIATLESTSLSCLLPQLFKSTSTASTSSLTSTPRLSPIEVVIRFVASTRGPEGVLDLVLSIWETAIEEIIGRESSRTKYDVKGKARGGTGSRERELENFLVGLLEVVDSLGYEVMRSGMIGGPFSLIGLEPVFVNLINDVREMNRDQPSTSKRVQQHSKIIDPQSWSTAMTDTLKTVGSVGIYSAATIGGVGISSIANVANLFYPTLSQSPTPTILDSTTITTPIPYVRKTIRSASPSQFISQQQSQLDSKLTAAATSLLQHLTLSSDPTSSSIIAPRPLLEILLSCLLSKSFPLTKDGGKGHRKTLLLAVVRFFGFSWLGRKISKAGNGGGFVGQTISSSVELISPLSSIGKDGRASKAMLDGVYIDTSEAVEIMSGLHRVVYEAIVGASCGSPGKEREDREDRLRLRRTAKGFVDNWSNPRSDDQGRMQTEKDEIRPFLVSSAQFLELYSHFATLVTHLPASRLSSQSSTPSQQRPNQSSPTFSRSATTAELDGSIEELRGKSHSDFDDSTVFFAKTVAMERSVLELSTRIPYFESLTIPPSVTPLDPQRTSADRQAHGSVMSLKQTNVLRQGVMLLIESGYSSPLSSSLTLAAAFSTAALVALTCHEHSIYLLYDQCSALLASFPSDRNILTSIAEPLRRSKSAALEKVDHLQRCLMNLAGQRIRAIECARIALSDIDEIRIRAYYSFLRSTKSGIALRSRVKEIMDPCRSAADRIQGKRELGEWDKSKGVYDFIQANVDESWFEEILMECRKVIEGWVDEKGLRESGFWKREGEVYSPPPSSLSASPSHPPDRMLFPFGAFSSALMVPIASTPHPLDQSISIEEHLQKTTFAITSYLWSEISTAIPSPLLGHSGMLLGSDSLHAIRYTIDPRFSSSSSTAPPPSPATPHLSLLIGTFLRHPSLRNKLQALVDIKSCLGLTNHDPEPADQSKHDHLDLFAPSYSSHHQELSTDTLLPLLESLLLNASPLSSLSPSSSLSPTSSLLHAFPTNLFATLQAISSLVPSTSILNSHTMGKAFWDLAAAATSIKKDWLSEIAEAEREREQAGERFVINC